MEIDTWTQMGTGTPFHGLNWYIICIMVTLKKGHIELRHL